MDIVIDTSVVIAVVTYESSRKSALAITAGNSLIAPESLHWEIGNALSAMLKRKRMNADEAKSCIQAYSQIPIRLIAVDLSASLELSDRLSLYAYDTYILACALKYRSPLLTLDQSLSAAAAALGIEVLEL